ncbi:MAG TPA: response regulator [Candidatus Acidoferrum sp.]|nr:response regulator [Candidatus Acidoferrum sp.]
MTKLLVVDDDDAMRRVIRLNLADIYDIIDTGEPEHALALALEHKPEAILLDLRMPKYSGFELCQTFTSFSSTQMIPVLVISGEAGAKTKQFCRDLGAVAYFEKPVDFDALRMQLADFLKVRRKERRSEVRVRLRVPLRVTGREENGEEFGIHTTTENVSRSAFLCACAAALSEGSPLEVYLVGAQDEHVGRAQVIRSEWKDTPYPRYACRFIENARHWVLE